MINGLITGVLEFFRNLVDIFLNPLIDALDNLPGMEGLQDFYQGFSTILLHITEGGIFVKRFLMLPNGLISSFFILLTGLTICWGIVSGIQFIIRVYNMIKGPI